MSHVPTDGCQRALGVLQSVSIEASRWFLKADPCRVLLNSHGNEDISCHHKIPLAQERPQITHQSKLGKAFRTPYSLHLQFWKELQFQQDLQIMDLLL